MGVPQGNNYPLGPPKLFARERVLAPCILHGPLEGSLDRRLRFRRRLGRRFRRRLGLRFRRRLGLRFRRRLGRRFRRRLGRRFRRRLGRRFRRRLGRRAPLQGLVSLPSLPAGAGGCTADPGDVTLPDPHTTRYRQLDADVPGGFHRASALCTRPFVGLVEGRHGRPGLAVEGRDADCITVHRCYADSVDGLRRREADADQGQGDHTGHPILFARHQPRPPFMGFDFKPSQEVPSLALTNQP